MSKRIIAISDLHGTLPDIDPCDILIIAGDVCPTSNHTVSFQNLWLHTKFAPWLKSLPAKRIVGIAGNHDWVFEKRPEAVMDLPWTYLIDNYCTIDGLRIFGTPWSNRFFDWAFNLDPPELDKVFAAIDRADIIVSHGPPYGYGDQAPRDEYPFYEKTGSIGFLAAIERLKPRLCIYGHIHEGRGQWKYGETILANATIKDDKYRHVYEPMVFDVDEDGQVFAVTPTTQDDGAKGATYECDELCGAEDEERISRLGA